MGGRRRVFLQSGLAFIELAVILPIILTLVFGIAFLYRYMHAYQSVKYAAEWGAAVASSAEIKALNNPAQSYLRWTHEAGGDLPERPLLQLLTEQCRSSLEPAQLNNCIENAIKQERLQALIQEVEGLEPMDFIHRGYKLPFALSEPSSYTPGYNLVQMLPIIGIERACFEPFNETGSLIGFGTNRHFQREVRDSDTIYCRHVRPMYWQSPVKADFDGDYKEDLVFFKPRGQSSSWGANTHREDIDFIVYISGGAYSISAGLGYFNLTTEQFPGPIPVVADYDRDGLSDYAVFEPASGIYRIAFSSTRYAVIKEGYMGLSDPGGELGLIAIPGTFERTDASQLAVIQTGAANSQDRFSIWLTPPIKPTLAGLLDDSFVLPDGVRMAAFDSNTEAHKFKPHRGTVSVPAFADYDDDGIVEAGYLSWYGGNLARQIGGKVSGAAEYVAKLFEPVNYKPTTPLEVRMNPFRLAFDSGGAMYYVDSIDHRIWGVYPNSPEPDNLLGAAVKPVMPLHANLPPRHTLAGFDAEQAFPRHNVRNLPVGQNHAFFDIGQEGGRLEPEDLEAGKRVLRYPGAIAVGPDNTMYIADTKNKRILQIQDANQDGFDSLDNSRVVLGSNVCALQNCEDLGFSENRLSDDDKEPVGDRYESGPYDIWPTALAVVPIDGQPQKYALAFASKYAIYLMLPSAMVLSGGPQGRDDEEIYKIAGIHSRPPLARPVDSFDVSFKQYFLPNNAQGSTICPVTDLEYYTGGEGVALLASISCSLVGSPAIGDSPAQRPDWYPEGQIAHWAKTGGIIMIQPPGGSRTFTTGLNRTQAVAGSLRQFPCRHGQCSTPAQHLDHTGVFQRKMDLGASLSDIDMVNPVDIEVGPHNSILFIDQWSDAPIFDAEYFPWNIPPTMTDHHHAQGIYLIDPKSDSLIPITNPLQYGHGTIPVQGNEWHSPSRQGSVNAFPKTIEAHEAPVKNIPLPAVSSLAISGGYIYAATPFLANPIPYLVHSLPWPHPYKTDPAYIGFIHRVALDMDGDGISDFDDPDIDGDGILNTAENSPRSRFCPEMHGPSNAKCRIQEKIGNPLWYFFKLDGRALALDHKYEPGAPSGKDYGEFFFFNSVGECGPEWECGKFPIAGSAARPEVWATLLNFGDDQDFSAGLPSACLDGYELGNSPYYECINSSNGPIAVPHVLNSFVGDPVCGNDGGQPCAYSGEGFQAAARPGTARDPLSGLFLFPGILSSTHPKENGIKIVRRVPLSLAKQPGIRKSGVLCWDYTFEKKDGAQPVAAYGLPFQLNLENYLDNYLFSGFHEQWDSQEDNDNLNYMVHCAADLPALPDGRKAAVEGIVLQLDHDDTDDKENSRATHWPHGWITGPPEKPENQRRFLLIDHDGRGLRMPSWLLEVLPAKQLDIGGPPYSYTLASINRLKTCAENDLSFTANARKPFSLPGLLILGPWIDLGSSTLRPPYLPVNDCWAPEELINKNFKFDAGMQIETQDLETVFISLDFEPFVARALEIKGIDDVGAAMYRNYTQSNRFMTVDGSEPPPLTAARNALKLSLNLNNTNFVAGPKELGDGKAYVGFLKKQGGDWEPCEASPSSPVPNQPAVCDGIEVIYQTKILGRRFIMSNRQSFLYSNLTPYLQQCDPEAPEEYPCPL